MQNRPAKIVENSTSATCKSVNIQIDTPQKLPNKTQARDKAFCTSSSRLHNVHVHSPKIIKYMFCIYHIVQALHTNKAKISRTGEQKA